MKDVLLLQFTSIVIAAFILSIIWTGALLLKRKFYSKQRTVSQVKDARLKFEAYLYYLMDAHYLSYWYYSNGEYKIKFKPGQIDMIKVYGYDAAITAAEKSDQS